MSLRRIVNSRGAPWGIGSGLAYGLFMRIAIDSSSSAPLLVMSLAFIVFVPFVVGHLTVSAVERPSRTYAVFAPWLTCLLSIGATMVLGLEGSICVIFGSPIMLLAASLGGLVAREATGRPAALRVAVLILPVGVATFESGVPLHDRIETTVTEIEIAAPPAQVWPYVVSVDTIRASERRPALFTRIGFPAPIAATLDHEGVGGVRTASFERGLVFREAVTTWEPGRRLSFTIDATQVPPGALDDHVKVGGPFFDVLTGTYELIPVGDDRTRLRLTSEDRVGTHLNWYASGWAHLVMRSIQRNILEVLKTRAERPQTPSVVPGRKVIGTKPG